MAKPNGHDQGPAIEPITPLDFIKLEGLVVPERRWFIPGWIPMGRVSGLYGESKVGKSLAAQMLMTSTALGRPWFGLPVHPGKTLGVFCEDDDEELFIRQAAINKHYGCGFGDLENMMALGRLGHNNVMMTFEGGAPRLTPFFYQVLDLVKDFGAESFVVDTKADVFGGNENDGAQARLFVQQALGLIARDIRGIVLLNAHPSRAGTRSGAGDGGSVQWDATLRTRLLLDRPRVENGDEPDRYARTLSLASSNYAARDERIDLVWQDHVFVRKDQPTGVFATIQRRSCEAVFLELVDKSERRGQRLSPSINSPSYAPKLFAHYSAKDRGDFKVRDFERAMHILFDNGDIHNQQEGTPSHPSSRIVRVVSEAAK